MLHALIPRTLYIVFSKRRYILHIKSAKKSLTQAFSRHIIGVASEQKKCTEAKKNKNKNSNKKTPQKTTVPRRRSFLLGNSRHKNTRQIKSGAFVGGAGGYCPRVQMVTNYSSTNIVYSRFCNALKILRINKHDLSCAQ